MGVLAHVRLEQLESGQQKFLYFFKALPPHQDNQAGVDFPQRLLVDEMKPFGVHDLEHEEQLQVFCGMGGFTVCRRCGQGRVGDLAEITGNFPVDPHYFYV